MTEPNFPTVSGYCQIIDVWRKLGPNGFAWAVDKKRQGDATPDQVQSYVVMAIDYASNLIDEAVFEKIRPEVARGMGNPWLLDRCADIAVYETMRIGGRNIPEVMQKSRDDAIDRLNRVKDGFDIPGLVIPPAIGAPSFGSNRPRAVNIESS